MKKIMALLLVTAMLLSAVTITVGASEVTTEIANFDIDSLGLENGGDIFEKADYTAASNKVYFKYNDNNSFLYFFKGSGVSYNAFDEGNQNGQAAKISFAQTEANKSAQLIFLKNDITASTTDSSIILRTSNVAFSFDIKIPTGLSLTVYTSGLQSTSTSLSEGSNLTSTIFSTDATGTTLKTNNYTKDSTNKTTESHTDTTFKRDEYVNFKIIYHYDNGTYDLYVNNSLVAAGKTLAGSTFLSNFYVQLSHAANTDEADAYIDNLSFRVLAEDDLKQVYVSDAIENGTLTLNETFTEVGKPITFTATPDEGCKLTSLTLDGKEIEGLSFTENGGTYTIESLPNGGELKAVFEEIRTTTEVAKFDVDSLEGVQAETNLKDYCNDFYPTDKTYYFTYNGSKGFMQVENQNAASNITVEQESDGNKVIAIEKAAGTADASKPYVGFTFLPRFDSNTSNTVGQELCRTSDVAFSFKVKLPDNATAFIYTGGQNSSDTTATTSYDSMTLLAYTKNQVNTNVRVLDNCIGSSSTSTYDKATEDVDTFLRNEWTEFKIIYDYDNGTFDVYVNDRLLAENQKIHYPKFLLNFCVRIYLNSGSRPKAYIDDIKFYTLAEEDTKAQPNVAKRGNGTVAFEKADTIARADEEITYTITPGSGSYIGSVTYGGEPIPAYDASGVTLEKTAENKKLAVIFRDYADSAPALMISPLKFKEGDSTYLFMKLLLNNVTVSECGMVISTTEAEPTAENAAIVPFRFPIQQYGYYGYRLINKTGVADQPFYVRPYAKVGNDYIYGDVQLIEPANI